MRLPLSRKQFRDALEKGLGRAMLHARKHGLEGMHGELRWALLKSRVYDPQCEWHRPDWLWKLLRAARCEGRHRAAILNSLSKVTDYRDAKQLSALACRYALAGDAAAKRRLYAASERFVGVDNHGIERELMRLDGTRALKQVADRIGKELAKGGDDWKFRVRSIWWNAKNILGAGASARALAGGGSRARLFLKRALAIEASDRIEDRTRKARLKAEGPKRKTWLEFRSDLETKGSSASPYLFARHATAGELRDAYKALANEKRTLQAGKLLQVFNSRRPPSFEPFLLKFSRSSDEFVQNCAWNALAHFRRPEVRGLALTAARRRCNVGNGSLSLFAKNYRSGDAGLILEAVSGSWDPDTAHCVGMSVLGVAKVHADRSLAPAYAACYEFNPCALCRRDFFKKLLSLKSAPSWMIQECRDDTDSDTRSLANGAAK